MLDSIAVFLKIIEVGNFAAAARVLDLAPSSVTRQVEKLEQELGQRLFNRTTRSLSLTDAGRAFQQEALQIQERWQQLKTRLQASEEPSGALRVSVFESFGRLYISPLAIEFVKCYPNVDLSLELDDRMVDLYRDNVDIAIRSGPQQDSSLRARLLCNKSLLLVASPDYLARHGTPLQPEDLLQHNCLTFNRRRQIQHWYFHQHDQRRKIPIKGNFTTLGGEPIIQAARAGLGIAITAQWLVDHPAYAEGLIPVLPEWQVSPNEEGSVGIYAVYKNDPFERSVVRTFLDFLTARIQKT